LRKDDDFIFLFDTLIQYQKYSNTNSNNTFFTSYKELSTTLVYRLKKSPKVLVKSSHQKLLSKVLAKNIGDKFFGGYFSLWTKVAAKSSRQKNAKKLAITFLAATLVYIVK